MNKLEQAIVAVGVGVAGTAAGHYFAEAINQSPATVNANVHDCAGDLGPVATRSPILSVHCKQFKGVISYEVTETTRYTQDKDDAQYTNSDVLSSSTIYLLPSAADFIKQNEETPSDIADQKRMTDVLQYVCGGAFFIWAVGMSVASNRITRRKKSESEKSELAAE